MLLASSEELENELYKEETILGLPVSEIERQCQAYYIEPPFLPPINHLKNPVDVVIEGGQEILNNPELLKRCRRIYRNSNYN